MTNKNYYSANLLDVMKKVSEYWKIIFLCGIISGAIGFVVFNYFISPIYEANAIVIVNTRLDNSIAVTNDEIASAENLVDTYAVIIQSRTVLDAVIEKLNLSDTYKALDSSVTVSGIGGTQIIKIGVRRKSAEEATRILQEILNVAPDFIIKSVGAGTVSVIDQAQADLEPAWPNIPFYSLLAFFVGVIITTGVLVFRMSCEVTYSSEEALEKDTDLLILGVIPDRQSCAVKMRGRKNDRT